MSAVAFIILYYVNVAITGTEALNGIAAWLFLPAFVRLVAFLLIGYWSIPALFVSALVTIDFSLSPSSHIIVCAFFAIGAPIALGITTKQIGVSPSLKNLSGTQLLVLSVASALGSAAAYHIGLTVVGSQAHSAASFATTALGDAAGTWVVIYTIKLLLTFIGRFLP